MDYIAGGKGTSHFFGVSVAEEGFRGVVDIFAGWLPDTKRDSSSSYEILDALGGPWVRRCFCASCCLPQPRQRQGQESPRAHVDQGDHGNRRDVWEGVVG